jgi:hypothetical protein
VEGGLDRACPLVVGWAGGANHPQSGGTFEVLT